MFFVPMKNLSYFLLNIDQKEKDSSIEIHIKLFKAEMLATNTNLPYLNQAKEKHALCIKGPYICSIKEANRI